MVGKTQAALSCEEMESVNKICRSFDHGVGDGSPTSCILESHRHLYRLVVGNIEHKPFVAAETCKAQWVRKISPGLSESEMGRETELYSFFLQATVPA